MVAPETPVWGRYRVTEAVSRGAFGSVLRVTDAETGEARALKVVAPGRGEAMLLDEFEQLAKLRHPSLPRVFEVGRTQGPIAELAGGRAQDEVIVAVDDADLAERTLAGSPVVREVHRDEGALRVVLARDLDSAAELNASLVGAGVAVSRLEPVRHSLEQRFLDVISGLRSPTEGQLS